MKHQVERIKVGDFSESQFKAAKQMMINSLDGVYDDEYALCNFIFDSAYRNLSFDLNVHKENYQQITKQMIVESFQNVQSIFQFQLKGVQDETISQ